jgi:hypothetical protein
MPHYTCGFGFVWFFGLGCVSFVFCVWGDGLVHTVMLDCMLGSVGVVWEYVGCVWLWIIGLRGFNGFWLVGVGFGVGEPLTLYE